MPPRSIPIQKPEQSNKHTDKEEMNAGIVKLVNTFLTSYIREVNPSDVELSLFSGSVVLNNIVNPQEKDV